MKIIISIILAVIFFSCNSTEEPPAQEGILVKVGSDYITTEDFRNKLDKLSYKQKSIYTSTPEKLNDFLDTQINEKVLYNEALKRGILDRDDIREDVENYEKKLVAKTLGKEILEELELNQDEIKKHYEQNQKDYERIDISKIVIRFDNNEENSRELAFEKAELVSNKAQSGESFDELSEKYSDDPISKSRGGKVGYINRGRFPENIDEALFSLNKGDITKPFEVDGGYLIIKINSEVEKIPYTQVQGNIRSKLINQRLVDYINSLREEWDVQIYEDRLKEISKSESIQK